MTNFLASPIKYLPNFLNMYFEATPVQVLSSTLIQSLVRDFHTHIWFQVLRWEKFKPSRSLLQSRPFINLGVCVTPRIQRNSDHRVATCSTVVGTVFSVGAALLLINMPTSAFFKPDYCIILFKATSLQQEKLGDLLKPQAPRERDPDLPSSTPLAPPRGTDGTLAAPLLSKCLTDKRIEYTIFGYVLKYFRARILLWKT